MIYQAIVTKFLAPTNTQAGRIKATAAAGSVTVPYDHSLSQKGNHDVAARTLAEKKEWAGLWIAGGMPGSDGNVYVLIENATSLPNAIAFSVNAPR